MKTPYQQAGYKSKLHGDSYDTKFKVLCPVGPFKKNDVVILNCDDNSIVPEFRKEDRSKSSWLKLPGRTEDNPRLEVIPEHETLDEVLRMVRAVCLGDKVKPRCGDFCGAEKSFADGNNITQAAHYANQAAQWIDELGGKYILLSEDKSAKIAELEKKKAEAIAEFDKQIQGLKSEH